MNIKYQKLTALLLVLILALGIPPATHAAGISIQRISVSSGGQEGNGDSSNAALSGNGRNVAFDSASDNLVAGDTNTTRDVFVRDTLTGAVTRVSVAWDQSQSNNESSHPALSRNGRYVVFQSSADNLVAGDTNLSADIFLRDTQLNTTVRVSMAWDGSQSNGSSFSASISDDGRFVAFASDADDLVPADTNLATDIFVRDLLNAETTRASVTRNGLIIVQSDGISYDPVISADGSTVAYESIATNLVSGDNNGNWDIFVSLPQVALTSRVSVSTGGTDPGGASHHPAMSGDGRYVAFDSDAADLVFGDNNFKSDVFVRDTVNNTTLRVTYSSTGAQGNDNSGKPSISDDGRFVTFESAASNLVSTDGNSKADVFVRDTWLGITLRASLASDGSEGNNGSVDPAISADGRYTGFESGADDLVPNDNNTSFDIFRRTVIQTSVLRSTGAQDGWILENAETGNAGGSLDSASTTLRLGDDVLRRQYRGILSFTTASLPDNAILTRVTLRVRRQGIIGGGDPVTTFQGFMLDVRKGSLGTSALQITDWQANSNKTLGPLNTPISAGWYVFNLTGAKTLINKLATAGGLTQVRLRFKLDDNNNSIANFLSLFSGNAPAASRPQLIVEYYVP